MKDAVIVSGARTAMGKGRKGTLRTVRPDDLAACVIREAVERAAGLDPADGEDVLLGCAIPEQEQGNPPAEPNRQPRGQPGAAVAISACPRSRPHSLPGRG